MTAEPPLRVLVADDDAVVRDALVEVLASVGDVDVVAVAADAEEAIALAARHVPAVAIVDVRMGGGGVRAAEGIRRRSPATRIVALSAYGDTATMEAMRAAGADAYVVKGAHIRELLAALRPG